MSDDSLQRESDVSVEILRQFLIDRDVECPQCGYNLRNLTGDRCPECGEQINLQLSLVEPKQKLLIAGLIGLASAVGLNGLLLLYALIRICFADTFYGFGRFFIVNGIEFAVVSAAMMLWLRKWKRIRRMSTAKRRTLAMACWGLALADITLFAIYIK